jgi:hypothetical protein
MVTRLTGGNSPGDGADPRTFPAVYDELADAVEAVAQTVDRPARLWLPAVQWTDGTTYSMNNNGDGEWANRAFPAGSLVGTRTTFVAPAGWEAFDAYVWWAPSDGAAGAVYWRWHSVAAGLAQIGPGQTLGMANNLLFTSAVAPGVTDRVVRTLLAAGETLVEPGGRIVRPVVSRAGNNALDTYGSSVRMFGVELVHNRLLGLADWPVAEEQLVQGAVT